MPGDVLPPVAGAEVEATAAASPGTAPPSWAPGGRGVLWEEDGLALLLLTSLGTSFLSSSRQGNQNL